MPYQSNGPFDARIEADKIEHLAKERIDTANTFLNYPTSDGIAAARKLAEEWVSLDQPERTAVAEALMSNYHNGTANSLPMPSIETNQNGQMIGLKFDAAFLDWNLGPSSIKLTATDGRVIESRGCRLHAACDNPDYFSDYIGGDPISSQSN